MRQIEARRVQEWNRFDNFQGVFHGSLNCQAHKKVLPPRDWSGTPLFNRIGDVLIRPVVAVRRSVSVVPGERRTARRINPIDTAKRPTSIESNTATIDKDPSRRQFASVFDRFDRRGVAYDARRSVDDEVGRSTQDYMPITTDRVEMIRGRADGRVDSTGNRSAIRHRKLGDASSSC